MCSSDQSMWRKVREALWIIIDEGIRTINTVPRDCTATLAPPHLSALPDGPILVPTGFLEAHVSPPRARPMVQDRVRVPRADTSHRSHIAPVLPLETL